MTHERRRVTRRDNERSWQHGVHCGFEQLCTNALYVLYSAYMLKIKDVAGVSGTRPMLGERAMIGNPSFC